MDRTRIARSRPIPKALLASSPVLDRVGVGLEMNGWVRGWFARFDWLGPGARKAWAPIEIQNPHHPLFLSIPAGGGEQKCYVAPSLSRGPVRKRPDEIPKSPLAAAPRYRQEVLLCCCCVDRSIRSTHITQHTSAPPETHSAGTIRPLVSSSVKAAAAVGSSRLGGLLCCCLVASSCLQHRHGHPLAGAAAFSTASTSSTSNGSSGSMSSKLQGQQQPKGAVVFLHGSGDSGKNLALMLRYSKFEDELRDLGLELICPTAKPRPYTYAGGMRSTVWFDRTDLHADAPEDAKGADESYEMVRGFWVGLLVWVWVGSDGLA